MYRLQNILINGYTGTDNMKNMYYRSSDDIYDGANGEGVLYKDNHFEFFTYYNALSVQKWKKYTYAEKFYLVLEAEGELTVDLFGHFVDRGNSIQKEWMGSYGYDLPERMRIVLPYPERMQSSVAAFQIKVHKKTVIYDAYYATDMNLCRISAPYISLVTTTFQKESYVQRNIELLSKHIFSDPEYAHAFCWNIIDNGRTIPEQTDPGEDIKIFHNRNVGGAGGFARGILESLRQSESPTHILLMDDDVVFSAESFKRIYKLLSILRPEYKDHFISGAMLNMTKPNIQHEDIGIFNLYGEHGPVKPQYDLNRWDSVLLNEVLLPDDVHQYSGWWYCCIPSRIVNRDNLPLPVFVRGDDVEYSIRNHTGFITMNGICIWHEGFENKFSGALELYQVHRNDLILQAMHKEVSDVLLIKRIQDLFWQEMYKFDYKGAALLLDSVEDYLRGPEYIKGLDGQACMQEKKKLDNTLCDITPEIEQLIDYEKLYCCEPLGKLRKFLYDYSYNGHRLPMLLTKRKAGIIPYGWGYYQRKQYFTRVNYAIDPANHKYAVYERSDRTFRELKQRYGQIMDKYEKENNRVAGEYRACEKEMESGEFWEGYLEFWEGYLE